MSFIRPEAAQALSRWRDVLIGLGLIGIGIWWVIDGGDLLKIVAYAIIGVGALLMRVGIQRARFHPAKGGPGMVQVDEGRVTYFGPLTGGTADLAELSRLTLDRNAKPAHWGLHQPGQPPLMIPVNAAGADALFDAFSTLPGLQTQKMLAGLSSTDTGILTVWASAQAADYHDRLH